jgi:hypothetical protein
MIPHPSSSRHLQNIPQEQEVIIQADLMRMRAPLVWVLIDSFLNILENFMHFLRQITFWASGNWPQRLIVAAISDAGQLSVEPNCYPSSYRNVATISPDPYDTAPDHVYY